MVRLIRCEMSHPAVGRSGAAPRRSIGYARRVPDVLAPQDRRPTLPPNADRIAHRYEGRYRVRFDEAGAEGRLRASGILRYVQDLAWQHSEEAGFDRTWYRARGLSWLVRTAELRIHEAPSYGDILECSTEVIGWRRVLARRLSEIRAHDRRLYAEAIVDWVLMTEAWRPARVPPEVEAFAAPGATFTPVRLDLPATGPDLAVVPWPVRTADVDPMGHMNNATYLDLLDEALAAIRDDAPIGPGDVVRLGYLKPARRGMTVVVATWTGEGRRAFRVTGSRDEDLLVATLERHAVPVTPAR
jgi:acyl-CoA thioesterase FadM